MMKSRSRSLDDLKINEHRLSSNDSCVSNTTRTEFNLTEIGRTSATDESETVEPRSCRSAPVSPTHLHDKEFDAFIQCEQQVQIDHFIYNVDLSEENETRPTMPLVRMIDHL
jgi:hypothetical protein